jgi:hypothetical protein
MRCIAFVVTLAGVIASAPLAAAQLPDNDKLALARQVLDATVSPKMIEEQQAKLGLPAMPQFDEPTCRMPRLVVPATECVDKFRAFDRERVAAIKSLVASNLPVMLEDQAVAMAAAFSSEELLALRNFYTSDIGRSISRKQVEITVDVQKKLQERILREVGEFSKANSAKRTELRNAVLGRPATPPVSPQQPTPSKSEPQ